MAKTNKTPVKNGKLVAFINDTSNWYHWGCTGTSEAIKHELTERGYDSVSVTQEMLSKIETEHLSINDFDDLAYFKQFCQQYPDIISPIVQADIVMVNGEGTLHGLSKVPLMLLYIIYTAKRFLGKEVQVINHSCYPNNALEITNEAICNIYHGVYRLLDFVAIREHLSHDFMQKLQIDSTLSFDCLPLYITKYFTPASIAKPAPILVFGGTAKLELEGLKLFANYLESMRQEGYQLIFLSGARKVHAQDDLVFADNLKLLMPEGWQWVKASSMDEWLNTIALADILVSGRFHYTIAASVLKTPCVMFNSNTPKMDALSDIIGLAKPLEFTSKQLHNDLSKATNDIIGTTFGSDELTETLCQRAQMNFAGV